MRNILQALVLILQAATSLGSGKDAAQEAIRYCAEAQKICHAAFCETIEPHVLDEILRKGQEFRAGAMKLARELADLEASYSYGPASFGRDYSAPDIGTLRFTRQRHRELTFDLQLELILYQLRQRSRINDGNYLSDISQVMQGSTYSFGPHRKAAPVAETLRGLFGPVPPPRADEPGHILHPFDRIRGNIDLRGSFELLKLYELALQASRYSGRIRGARLVVSHLRGGVPVEVIYQATYSPESKDGSYTITRNGGSDIEMSRMKQASFVNSLTGNRVTSVKIDFSDTFSM